MSILDSARGIFENTSSGDIIEYGLVIMLIVISIVNVL